MTFVVTENCIKCKFTDCVDVCNVDCFHEGPDFLVIDPDECIDCTLCEPECPANAIYADDELPEDQVHFLELNAELSKKWPYITEVKEPFKEADKWNGILGKKSYLGIDISEEDLQVGFVSSVMNERIRSIRFAKQISDLQVETFLTDADESLRIAVLSRLDCILNPYQIERALLDPIPEVQLAYLQREDCSITLEQFDRGLKSTNNNVCIAYTKHYEHKLTPEQIETGLTASSSLVKFAYLDRPFVFLTSDQVTRGLTDPDTKFQWLIYERPDCILDKDKINWVIEYCCRRIVLSELNKHKKKLGLIDAINGFLSQDPEIRLFFAQLTSLDYPTDFIERGLTDNDENVRAGFAKRKDFTPSPAQVSRGIKDAEAVVRRAFSARKDIVISKEDKYQMYIDTLIGYEEDDDEEIIEKLIKKIKKEGGQFTFDEDEDEIVWNEIGEWNYPMLSITYTLKLDELVISEWVNEWGYNENHEIELGSDGEEYPLIREMAGFEIDYPDLPDLEELDEK